MELSPRLRLATTAKFAIFDAGAFGATVAVSDRSGEMESGASASASSKQKSDRGANDAASTPAAGPTTAAAAAAAAASDLSVPAFDKNDLYVSELGLDERYALCRGVAEECVQDEELRRLLEVKPHPVCYDGFEPSGRMHIAQGVLRVININRLTRAGCVFKFWIADWFAQLNNKMGGDLKKIQTVGKYFIEIWQAMGMDMRNVQFLWASEEINRRPDEYWRRVMEIARLVSVRRITRCCTIMGRAESEDMPAAQIMYPAMQCADIFFLKADICQLGLDQRKVNMLAREYCDLVKPKIKHKPVILSHHMISGLKEGQAKMSKSDPDSAIFMEDLETDVNRKIKGAFCKPEMVEGNPILDYAKHILFGYFGELKIVFSKEGSRERVYGSYEELEADYRSGVIHPSDLKPAVALGINKILQPVRDHFAKGDAKKLLDTIKKYQLDLLRAAKKEADAKATVPATSAAAADGTAAGGAAASAK